MIAVLHEYYSTERGGFLFDSYPPSVDVTKLHTYGWLWASNGVQFQGGYVCSYIDNIKMGCQATSAASEAQRMFLILSMGVGCNFYYANRSCSGSLTRADMYISRVTVFGQ